MGQTGLKTGQVGRWGTTNTVVEFITGKNIKPSCKKLSEDTLFTDFNMALEDEVTMNSARSTVDSKRPSDEFINEWKEQHNVKQEQGETMANDREKVGLNISYPLRTT